MKSRILFFLATALILTTIFDANCQTTETKADTTKKDYPIAKVSFEDYKNLMSEVEAHRAERLIDFDTFLEMSQDENTIILDTRSKERYNRIHIKGAVHLAFTEFTQKNLDRLIKDKQKRILIYCNNNIYGNSTDFASKTGMPTKSDFAREFNYYKTSVMLALNIPTYLNLYGYGYENVYELHEYVGVKDIRIKFEGSATGIHAARLPVTQLRKLKIERDEVKKD